MEGTIAVDIDSEQADILLEVLETLKCQDSVISNTWKKSNGCEKWTGVTCDKTGNVIELVLSTVNVTHPNGTVLVNKTAVFKATPKRGDEFGNIVNGTISANIAKLTSLQTLALHSNSLSGTIPSTIGNLTKLTILDLGENTFEGSIPASIGNLKKLIYLDLSRNQYKDGPFDDLTLVSSLNGTLPSELGNLINLEYLDLREDNFTGPFPSLTNVEKLIYLDLAANHFNGSFDFLGNFVDLLTLNIGGNQFDAGEFPVIIGNYTKLKFMSMRSSGLTGAVPNEFTKLSKLQYLDLADNSLTSIPPDFGNLVELTEIHFAANQLTSLESLKPLQKLKTLEFQNNGLTGSFPNCSNFYTLEYLDGSVNFYTGGFPTYFANFTGLTFLNLDYNNLGGEIPVSLSDLKKLTSLSCAQCGLVGEIPPGVATLPVLDNLDLSRNFLNGTIPADIGAGNLTYLDLSFNQLSGTIPPSIKKSEWLNELRLNNNALSGEIGNSLAPYLGVLWLFSNSFTGAIPKYIEDLTGISNIQLQDNRLDSNIPPQIFSTQAEFPVIIDLSRNNFGGSFPKGVESLSSTLQTLRMSKCGLKGALRPQISTLEALEILDLSNNGFSGPLPSLAEWTSLKQLNLANNFFEIETSSLPNSTLQKLDLSGIGLEWNDFPEFPKKYYSSLVALNLQANSISGNLSATYFNKFLKLQAIFLENNGLSGDISPITKIPNTTDIEYISLRSNQFDRLIGKVTSKVLVDLAYNPLCDASNVSNINPSLSQFCVDSGGTTSNYASKGCENIKCWEPTNKPKPKTCECSGFLGMQLIFAGSPLTYISKKAVTLLEEAILNRTQLNTNQLTVQVVTANLTDSLVFYVRLFSSTVACPESTVQALLLAGDAFDIPIVGISEYFNFTEVVQYKIPPSPPPPPLVTPTPPPPKGKDDMKTWIIILIVVVLAGMFFFTSLALIIYLVCYRERESKLQIKVGEGFVRQIPLSDVRQATNNFNEDMLLGVGGYGFVYKGVASNGEAWAVKRAKTISLKGLQDFEQEVSLISRMSHTNIVKLLGFCDRKNEQILVYELMTNGSLKSVLRPDEDSNKRPLTFEERVDIAIGSAEGLLYLHKFATPPLIHRDIKSDNILLDAKLVAKVADFGLVKDNPTGSVEEAMKTRVAGTPGYIDPEYYTNYQVTAKSDVYSFGVVLFELITAKSALIKEETTTDPDVPSLTTLPNWVQPYLSDISPIVDPRMGSFNEKAMKDFVKVATVCIERAARYRPNMEEVASRLRQVKNTILGVSETEVSSSHNDSDSVSQVNYNDSYMKNKDINHLAPLSESYAGR